MAFACSRLFVANTLRCTQGCFRQVATVSCQTSGYKPVVSEQTRPRQSCILQFIRRLSMEGGKPPKKPLTSFFLFRSDRFPELARQQPNASVTELAQQMGQLWRELPQTDKQRYVTAYQTEKLQYEQSLTPEMKQQLAQERISRRKKLQQYKKKRELRQLNCPKHPVNSYGVFLMERMHDRGNIPPRKYLSQIAEEWRNLPGEQKMPYKEQSVQNRKVYMEKLAVWEAAMTEAGHPELVRGYKLHQAKRPVRKRVKKATPKKKAAKKKTATKKKTVAKNKTVSKKTDVPKKKSVKKEKKVETEDATWMREE